MTEYEITEISDMKVLDGFFEANGLEFSAEHPVETDRVKCWAVREKSKEFIGGTALALRQGEYIIDGIAVAKEYRGRDIGHRLLMRAVAETKLRGGKKIYLVARAPEFFKKHGFKRVERHEAPNFFECLTCNQYGISCHPEVMLLEV